MMPSLLLRYMFIPFAGFLLICCGPYCNSSLIFYIRVICFTYFLFCRRLRKNPAMVCPSPRNRCPLTMVTMPSTISMLTIPPVILAIARNGML